MRIGYGYDVHKLKQGRPCVLCGVVIPSDFGPDGHSDADVPIHALIDALLGALALGDIGRHFPDTDLKWKNAKSTVLLKKTYAKVLDNGYMLSNADITIVLEAPKLFAYIENMRAVISNVLETDITNVSIKATTEEKADFVGDGDEIKSSAIVLLLPVNSQIKS